MMERPSISVGGVNINVSVNDKGVFIIRNKSTNEKVSIKNRDELDNLIKLIDLILMNLD